MSTTATTMLDVVNPFDLQKIGEVPLSSWDEIDAWLDQAVRLHRDPTNRLPAWKRIEILSKLAELMRAQQQELAFLIANEGGKPLKDARIEVARAIDGVGLCVKELSRLAGSEIPMDLTQAGAGRMAFTTREPIGPVVAISAFNHPLNLIVHQVGPAVATGCPVIVKPASDTPLSARNFVDLLHQAGLPEAWCRFALCENADAERMVRDPRTAFFSFIGSAKVGWMLRSKLAPGTRYALEHGGVAPVIVDATADADTMVPLLVKGGFYHAGQVCVSVQRVFVLDGAAEKIATQMAALAAQLKTGNAIEESCDVGPLIRPREVDRVESWVNEAIAAGAKCLTGGKRLGATTYAPTVLLEPPADAKVSTLEVFGPVVCIYSADSLEAAITAANALPYAFQSAAFTNRLDTALSCVKNLDASAVMINDHTAFRVDWMPFAGRKHSGYGVGGIGYTMQDMTEEKMAVFHLNTV